MKCNSRRSRDLRKGRYSEPGRIYFVTACCAQRQNVFEAQQNARIIVDEIDCQAIAGPFVSLAYVVMPDHIHWLFELKGEMSLEKIVGKVKGRSARRINQSRENCRRVWQAGFHDHALRFEEDIESIVDYMINNPVRAGLTKKVDDYPYWDSIWHRRVRG